jgi:hypothetical protein
VTVYEALVAPPTAEAALVGVKAGVPIATALAIVAVPRRAIDMTMAMATNLVTSLMGLRRDSLPCPVDE